MYFCVPYVCLLSMEKASDPPVTGVTDGFEPMEVLGIDPWSSGRAINVLNH